jgi:DNA-binding response OmpR family regulator
MNHRDPIAAEVRILVAETHDATRTFLVDNLTADGYAVQAVADHDAALAQLYDTPVDLMVADVNGPTLTLIDAIRNVERLGAQTPSDLPMIVLTAHVEELHRVRLLERGSDDVIAKPFSYTELRARIAAVLRRTAPRQPRPTIIAGQLRVDLHERRVTVAGTPVQLSDTEYRLLCTLGAEPTRVFTRHELMRAVWGYTGNRSRALDSHACRLRAKLAGAEHPLIVTVWGVGLQLIPATQEPS